MAHQVAIIDQDGWIVATNEEWDRFCLINGGRMDDCGVGSQYLEVSGKDVQLGVMSVLQGRKKVFRYEYPCHSPNEMRWFAMVVTPLKQAPDQLHMEGAVITHTNITDRKRLEMQQSKDFALAQAIQKSVLVPPIENENVMINALLRPSEHLSGDLYSWYQINERHYGVILLDIMGQGVASSLISMSLRALLPGIIRRVSDPERVYAELNKHFHSLFRSVIHSKHYFCTGIYLYIDVEQQSIKYFNAGHPAGILVGDGRNHLLKQTTTPIGLSEDMEPVTDQVQYEKEDQLAIFTDGVAGTLRMTIRESEHYMLSIADQLHPSKLEELSKGIFAGEQADDIAIVSVKL
ncbi:PP2C family protein-serine/threonine phosphatase [Halalkalibacter sp. APA_J-10(15)]|uniref:PP2C family protein-serine/threonine phosphatase n=1 Tax=unclassified Halalkalibacter TaxID=2893063 RepID=UPI001FF4B22C|nr:PP2C family protein-serine/threonine phosphatase [Halalkalibacter sp. APA_J-10(15)]MCK0469915.1 serine/threonine-protein phosphatase [Halalkalibacter sp. APA_J-10(15)]